MIHRSLFERPHRGGHFVDPSLRAILESSLTPDDNDLHVSNLFGTPVLAVHGFVIHCFLNGSLESESIFLCRGNDENVPVWHTRELVATLKSWYPKADVTYVYFAALHSLLNSHQDFWKILPVAIGTLPF